MSIMLKKAQRKKVLQLAENADVRMKIFDDRPPLQPRKTAREGWFSPEYSESVVVAIDNRMAENSRCACLFPNRAETEYYKMLRTRIHDQMQSKGWKSLMVTSARPGEGKTLTSINLALSFAKDYEQTVLLVDADLQNQKIHHYLGYDHLHSLVDYLEEGMALNDIIVWPGIEKLTIISGNHTVQDSTEILMSPLMRSLVSEMKTRYENRYILFDVPPVLNNADAISFASLVDAILVVVQSGKTDLRDVHQALEMLPQEKIMGFALNRQEKLATSSYSKLSPKKRNPAWSIISRLIPFRNRK